MQHAPNGGNPKRKVGRPRAGARKREWRITVRINRSEAIELSDAAAASGKRLAQFVRYQALNAARTRGNRI